MKKTIQLLLTALLLSASSVAVAEDAPDARFEVVLKALDVIPTRANLDAQFPDAQDRLIASATDESRSLYERQRAISLTSLYPNAKTQNFLTQLTASDDAEMRRIAYYTLGRAFGAIADDALVAVLGKGLSDKNAKVQQYTARALRYVQNERAAELLRGAASSSDVTLASIAKRALEKRVRAAASTH